MEFDEITAANFKSLLKLHCDKYRDVGIFFKDTILSSLRSKICDEEIKESFITLLKALTKGNEYAAEAFDLQEVLGKVSLMLFTSDRVSTDTLSMLLKFFSTNWTGFDFVNSTVDSILCKCKCSDEEVKTLVTARNEMIASTLLFITQYREGLRKVVECFDKFPDTNNSIGKYICKISMLKSALLSEVL